MKKILGILLLVALLLTTGTANALNVQASHPNVGPTGTFNIYGARTLDQLQFGAGIFSQYTKDPLEIHNFTTGAQIRKVVNYQWTNDLVAEIGATDWLTFGFDMPFTSSSHYLMTDITQKQTNFSLGDTIFYGKVAALHPNKFPVGLSVMPYVIAPTGKTKNFTGDAGVDGGFNIIADKEFDRGYLGVNVGVKIHGKKDNVNFVGSTANLSVGNEFTYGAGGAIEVIDDKLAVFAETKGSTQLGSFGKDEQTSPIEVNGGLKGSIKNKMVNFYAGAGAGINGGYSAPQYRVFGGVTVNWPATKYPAKAEKATTINVIDTILIYGVNFNTASWELTRKSKAILDKNIVALSKYPSEHFKIIGHTDYRGSDEYNQKLSERRAEAVYNYFATKGIPKDRMEWEGKGKTQPLVSNDTPENMEANRRVEIQVIQDVKKSTKSKI